MGSFIRCTALIGLLWVPQAYAFAVFSEGEMSAHDTTQRVVLQRVAAAQSKTTVQSVSRLRVAKKVAALHTLKSTAIPETRESLVPVSYSISRQDAVTLAFIGSIPFFTITLTL